MTGEYRQPGITVRDMAEYHGHFGPDPQLMTHELLQRGMMVQRVDVNYDAARMEQEYVITGTMRQEMAMRCRSIPINIITQPGEIPTRQSRRINRKVTL